MVVVTGGAGFIGSCLIDQLNSEGIEDILVVDHMTDSDKWKNLIGKKFLDYYDRDDFRMLMSEGFLADMVDTFYHMGACSATTETDVNYLLDNNFAYSKEAFAYASQGGADFIYASSAATYGSGEDGYSDKSIGGLKPMNAYGYSKHIFDSWLQANGYADEALGIKFFNVFGPNEYHKGSMASMVYKAWSQISKSEKIRLFRSNDKQYEDGGQKRDFIYVKDACKAVTSIAGKKSKGIYNLGTGKARSWNDLAHAVFAAMGKEPKIEYIDMPVELSGQYQNYTQAEMGKFHDSVDGFKFSELEETVKDYVNGYLQQSWKYI
jgi:ADP-L-glycero-D-manno-heptose 6-epimerase